VKSKYHVLGSLLAVVLIALLFGCVAQSPTATLMPPTPPPTNTPVPGQPILEVIGPEGSLSYTLGDLKALPVTEGQGGIKPSTGRVTLSKALNIGEEGLDAVYGQVQVDLDFQRSAHRHPAGPPAGVASIPG
jgi:hypothetical protein